jgi:hypothetical protein
MSPRFAALAARLAEPPSSGRTQFTTTVAIPAGAEIRFDAAENRMFIEFRGQRLVQAQPFVLPDYRQPPKQYKPETMLEAVGAAFLILATIVIVGLTVGTLLQPLVNP